MQVLKQFLSIFMELTTLTAISPLDGRYGNKTANLRAFASEFGLIKARLQVEIAWFCHLAQHPQIEQLPPLQLADYEFLQQQLSQFDVEDAQAIKQLEATTNHDVKAVEYFLKNLFNQRPNLIPYKEFIHLACTSEDINNIAYALLLKNLRNQCYLPRFNQVIEQLNSMAHDFAEDAMLARTHGQPASPTTMGKELANFVDRLQQSYQQLAEITIKAKCNGAVGNFNAHHIAYPDIDWLDITQDFLEQLGLQQQIMTTQIEPHDQIANISHHIAHINTIIIDMCQDIWGYIAWGYCQQKHQANEVGSSTMPHKINPIDFENAEGNAGLANALWYHFAQKLPKSRFQRDLSDSTVMRNIGSAFAYSDLTLQSLLKGLSQISPNREKLQADLNQHWEILGEALQTIMRIYNINEPYEQLKQLSRGQVLTQDKLHAFIDGLALPEEVQQRLKSLKPQDYTGYAAQLARSIRSETPYSNQ